MQINLPLFSIILPCYNRSVEVICAINSVLLQSFENFELIVVDDGSTDNTVSIISTKFNDSRLKIHPIPHSGRSKARNFGINKSIGKWICFLDSDDEYLQHILEHFNNYIHIYPQYSAFACEQTFDHKPRKYLNQKHEADNYVFTFKDFISDNPISLNQLCYKSDLQCYFPDEDMENSEDWYFFRLLAYKTSILKFNEAGVNVNDHEQRSIYTISPSIFVANNIKSTLLLTEKLNINKRDKQNLHVFTYLLCTNIILSKTKNKKEAFQYFKKALSLRALCYLNFYKAIFKFLFF
jgi:glycosyltransferase involved in cell wall biosynthesis